MSEANLIDRAWSTYEKHQRQRGQNSDELSFVGGFMSCYGMLTGRVDVGLPKDATVLQGFELIQRELDSYRREVIAKQAEQQQRGG